jgi:hypothetical protein
MSESGGGAVGVTASERSSRSAANLVVREPVVMTHCSMSAVSLGGRQRRFDVRSACFGGVDRRDLTKN